MPKSNVVKMEMVDTSRLPRKICIICKKEFIVTKPAMKTCLNPECKKGRTKQKWNEYMRDYNRRHREDTKATEKSLTGGIEG